MIRLQRDWWKFFIVLAILVLFFIMNPFGCNKPIPPTVVTTVKHDTTYVQQPPVYIPLYIPQASSSQAPIIIPPQYQPSTDNATLLKQYIEVTNKYLSVTTYKDSIQLKDSAGKRVGVVTIEDIVSENQIKNRKPSYQLTFPSYYTNTTTTITLHDPKRFQVLVGTGLTGNQSQFLNGAYVGLGFRNKKEQIFLLNGGIQNSNGLKTQFGVATYIPLRLKKKQND